ncbi:transglutaminase domain-containing protein [Ureaplasma ceti]|uniref:Transglutaminase-like domain-containing protein n=1 Tax=Ureaplasma ceti TaxID=3119530 RepID=A0ABP9U5V5_9BACT
MKKTNKIIASTLGVAILATTVITPTVIFSNNKNHSKLLNQNSTVNVMNNAQQANIGHSFVNGLFTYEITTSKTVSITGFSANNATPNLEIPSTVSYQNHLYFVTTVNAGAFYNQQLSSVVLPDSLQTIGNYAFANNNLTQVKLPKFLKNLGINAFVGNCFGRNATIYLPPQTTWYKDWMRAPFGTLNNAGLLTDGVQTIIQNGAVYSYSSVQRQWVITSYLSNATAYDNEFTIVNADKKFSKQIEEPVKQAPYKEINKQDITPVEATSLAKTCISFKNAWNGVSGLISFNTKTMTLESKVFKGGWLFNKGQNLNIYIYSPKNNQTIINKTYKGDTFVSEEMSKVLNGAKFNYGDIIGLKQTVFWHNGSSFISTNYTPGMNLKDLNTYEQIPFAWTSVNNMMTYFVIKPDGLHQMHNCYYIKNCYYRDGQVQLSGTTLPNKTITISYLGKQHELHSDSNGDFELNISSTNQQAQTNLVTLNIANVGIFNQHVTGFNPLDSAIGMNVPTIASNGKKGSTAFNVLFNGFSNKMYVWNSQSRTGFPSFENLYAQNDLPKGLDSKTTFADKGLLNIIINGAKYTCQWTKGESISKLESFINGLPYSDNETLEIQTQGINVKNIDSNFKLISYGSTTQETTNAATKAKEKLWCIKLSINSEGIKSLISPNQRDINDQWGNPDWFKHTFTYGGDGFVGFGGRGSLEMGGMHSNFNNPDATFKKVLQQITTGYASDLNKALAIEEWVSQNMKYTFKYTYGHTVNGTFQHLQGICGNFAMLAATMLSDSGIVSRVIYGDALDPAGLNSMYGIIDHAWTQAWIPSLGTWLTLDPTWSWYGPLGQVQSGFSIHRSNNYVALVEWPRGTDYFSYFKGHEDQALTDCGRYFYIQAGRKYANYYNPAYASALTALFKKASTASSNQFFSIQWNKTK